MVMNKKLMNRRRMLAFGLFFILIICFGGFIYYAAVATSVIPGGVDMPPIGDETELSGEFGSSVTVWQGLYVYPVSGEPYWVNAPEPFFLADILGSKSGVGDDFTEVSKMQNTVYMNCPFAASSVLFQAEETISITDEMGNLVKTLSDVDHKFFSGDAFGKPVEAGENIAVASATVTGDQLEQILSLPSGTYYLLVEMSNLNLILDGQTYSAAAGSDMNVLSWLIQVP
jgi:hypothetical protein